MHDTGCSGLVHWDHPEGWDREGGGRGVQDGEHMYTHGGFISMYDRTMGNTCTPMVDSYQCMTEPIQYCKIKKERKKEN